MWTPLFRNATLFSFRLDKLSGRKQTKRTVRNVLTNKLRLYLIKIIWVVIVYDFLHL